VTDFRRFLGVTTTEVLPYFGGPCIDARDRRLRITRRVEPGFWRCTISGRDAEPTERAAAPDLAGLPSVRGHTFADYVVQSGGHAELFALGADEPPAPFSPVIARRWPSGDVIFDALDFETEAEELVRRAFEDHASIEGVKGVPSSLRAAFGYAVMQRVADERNIAVAPLEVRHAVGRIADGGHTVANDLLQRIVLERRRAARDEWVRPAVRTRAVPEDAEIRAELALLAAGAAPLATRYRADGLLEVRYRFEGERFVSIVDAATLQVVDAGICLAGHDRLVTLESLPGVIREAMLDREIVITGRWR
jgi:hypothetical protein